MAATSWNSAYELEPASTDAPSGGDDQIRQLKENLRTRLEYEHAWAVGTPGATAQGWHSEGSAKVYVQAAAPTNRPDGSTALTSADEGRVWIDSDDDTADYYDGSDFVDIKMPEIDLIRGHMDKSADYTILDDDENVVLVTTGVSTATITLPTAADNANRVITAKKVDSGVGDLIVDGEGAETIDGETTITVHGKYGLWTGFCDGTEWHTLQHNDSGAVQYAMNQDVETDDSVSFANLTLSGTFNPEESPAGSSDDLAHTETYVIPRGIYIAASEGLRLDVKEGGAWHGSGSLFYGGAIISDGTNVRFYNSHPANRAYWLLKF